MSLRKCSSNKNKGLKNAKMRDCGNCQNYKLGDSGYWSCCKWECSFVPKEGCKDGKKETREYKTKDT